LANWGEKKEKRKALIWNFLQLGLQIMLDFFGDLCTTLKKMERKNKFKKIMNANSA
jgi:hypothetical protein